MDKRFWGIIVIIGVLFLGIVWANNRNNDTTSSNTGAAATTHLKGNDTQTVTLVEYGDFQCPVCSTYEPVLQTVYEKYKDTVTFQYRNFPLQQIHPNAFAAARAAEAANMQGKFWEMHDQLYATQNEWSNAGDPLTIYQRYAESLGLNVDQFKTDFASNQVNDAIKADMNAGNELNVTGTPTFYLNGELIELSKLVDETNRPSLDKFSELLDAELAKHSTNTTPESTTE